MTGRPGSSLECLDRMEFCDGTRPPWRAGPGPCPALFSSCIWPWTSPCGASPTRVGAPVAHNECRAHPLRTAAPRPRCTYGQCNHHRGRPRATSCTGPGSGSMCLAQRTRVPGTQSMTSGRGRQRAGRPVACVPRTWGWDAMEVGHCGPFKYGAQGRGPT